MIEITRPSQATTPAPSTLREAQVLLDNHIARLSGFGRRFAHLDPAGLIAAAVQGLQDLAGRLARTGDDTAPLPFHEPQVPDGTVFIRKGSAGSNSLFVRGGRVFVYDEEQGKEYWLRLPEMTVARLRASGQYDEIQPHAEAPHQVVSDLRALAAAESPADIASLPLVLTGQGDFQRAYRPDPLTGRLDCRA